ncbi:MAG: ABC transporter permease [Spirochaetaceae bacterium]|nr:ABC transporter permease [Spirochaetaceae bacterium]
MMKAAATTMEEKSNEQDLRSTQVSRFGKLVNAVGIYGIALLFIVLGIVLEVTGVIHGFMTIQNMMNIVDAVAILGMVAVGMAFVTYSGSFSDMSVPTTMALTGIIAIQMLQYGFWVAITSALGVGLIIGLINGLAIGKLRVNSMIWTLAMNYVTMGIIRLVWVNKQIYPDMTGASEQSIKMFDDIFRYKVFNAISLPVVVLALMVIAGQFIMSRTVFGAHLKLTGSSRRTAKFSGINVERIVTVAFVISAVAATIGGLTITSLGRVGAWYNGSGYDFKAVTAVVIGGMALSGGRGSIVGVLGGALVMGLMSNIMTLLGIGTFSQDMIRGAIFIIVVGINAKSLRSLGRDDA